MTSSAIPSETNSCSESPLMLMNGSTATEGLSGSASGACAAPIVSPTLRPGRMRYTRNGRAMFLTRCSPASSKAKIELIAYLITHHPIYADPARLRQGFEPHGDVHTVTMDVTAILDDVTEIDPNT